MLHMGGEIICNGYKYPIVPYLFNHYPFWHLGCCYKVKFYVDVVCFICFIFFIKV